VPEIVRLGMGPADMPELAQLLAKALVSDLAAQDLAPAVSAFRQRFKGLHYVRT
jgi:glycine hydroxymethyltransferase